MTPKPVNLQAWHKKPIKDIKPVAGFLDWLHGETHAFCPKGQSSCGGFCVMNSAEFKTFIEVIIGFILFFVVASWSIRLLQFFWKKVDGKFKKRTVWQKIKPISQTIIAVVILVILIVGLTMG